MRQSENRIKTSKEKVPTTFFVNQTCIDKGIPRSQSGCMAALSMKDAGVDRPFVENDGTVSFNWQRKRYVGVSDDLMKQAIVYDNDGEVKPFNFHIEDVASFDLSDVKGQRKYGAHLFQLAEERRELFQQYF